MVNVCACTCCQCTKPIADSAAWLYGQMRSKWDSPARGTVPIGWAVDSELSLRFPVIYKYLYATRSKNDFFIQGDSGAGYLNPTQLAPPRDSGLPSGFGPWRAWNSKYYRQFGLSFTGFLINGVAPETRAVEKLYGSFSFNGITEQHDGQHPTAELRNNRTLPVFHEGFDIVNMNASAAAAIMCSCVTPNGTSPQFMMFRTILETADAMHSFVEAAKAMCPTLTFVDPHIAGYLARLQLGGNNDNIATYLDDTVPASATAGASVSATFTIRNDGWNNLMPEAVSLNVTLVKSGQAAGFSSLIALPQTIEAGSTVVLRGSFGKIATRACCCQNGT